MTSFSIRPIVFYIHLDMKSGLWNGAKGTSGRYVNKSRPSDNLLINCDQSTLKPAQS